MTVIKLYSKPSVLSISMSYFSTQILWHTLSICPSETLIFLSWIYYFTICWIVSMNVRRVNSLDTPLIKHILSEQRNITFMFYRDLNVLTIFTSYKVLIASCQSHFMISEKFLREIMCTCDIISKYSRHLTCTEKSRHIPPPPQHCRNEKVRFHFFPLESHWVAMSSLSAVDFLVAVFFKLIWHGPFLIISSSSSEHEKWEHTDRQSLSSNRLLQTQIFFVRNIFNEKLSTDVLRTLVYFPP